MSHIDLAVVDIDRLGQATAQDGDLEHALHTGQRLVKEELAVRHQATVVVNETEQMRPAFLSRLAGVRQPGADQRVALPACPGRTVQAAH